MNEAPGRQAAVTGDLQATLDAGRFAITAEVNPPLAGEARFLLDKALPLKGLVNAVNLTDGPGAHVRMSALAAAAILVQHGIEPVLQMTCRDRNRIALQSDLLGATALGVRNFLLLRGDDPSAGDQPDAKPVFDLEARQLLAAAAAIGSRGELLSGRAIEGRAAMFLGAADMPIDPPPDWKPEALIAKADAGARFAQTQFCMDAGVVRRYVARLAEFGLTERLYLLVGIAPLRSAKSARWMRQHLYGTVIPDDILERMEAATDPQAEGRHICVELLRELAEIPGVAGAHIMAPLNEEAIPEVVAEFRG
ncbi:MAG TPA: methylenetetrahydrofolate reductase [Afifellaceae bacterium]|nr:methylenetetrahydrofolate reductase [Afifellaceae bacterium]